MGLSSDFDGPIYVKLGFMQGDQFNQQQRYKDKLYRKTVVNAECFVDSSQYADAGFCCIYAMGNFSQASGEIVKKRFFNF